MKKFLTVFSFALSLGLASFNLNSAHAQEQALPEIPAPIQNLVNEGAQIRYMGDDHGLQAWLTIKNGVEQYFYVMPDQNAFVMGMLFDKDGKLITVRQINRLRAQGDDILDDIADIPVKDTTAMQKEAMEFKSPSERLFYDVQNSNWVPLGQPNAPVIYSFVEPNCPHCHSFINDLLAQRLIREGKIQVRLIPIGFDEKGISQSAFLIAAPDPQDRWIRHMAGDETALPAKSGINQQGVQRNMAIMQSWKFDATPMIVYRNTGGEVKIIRGKPQDLNSILNDITK